MNTLPILTYHAVDLRPSVISITPGLFQTQMEILAENKLTGISLEQAFTQFRQTGRFPENAVVLTFDDGYLSVLENALPIMQAFGFSATVFIVTKAVGMNASEARLVNHDIDRDMLNWAQLESLLASGFEIGSHTLGHPWLTNLSHAEIEQELCESRQCLQKQLQIPVNSIAYPYGNLNREVKEIASKHYRFGCTTDLGRNTASPDPLSLKRLDVYYLQNPKIFSRVCRGKLEAYLCLRQYLRNIKQLSNKFSVGKL